MRRFKRLLTGSMELTPDRIAELRELQEGIKHSFKALELLERALIHRSFAYEQRLDGGNEIRDDYECLEFLGDAILGLIISEYLFRRFPFITEGELSKLKSFLVSTNHLAAISRDLKLGHFLRLSYGEEKTGGRCKKAILADLFESLTAAVYLDGGLPKARSFVLRQFELSLAQLDDGILDLHDYKSRLQERLHILGRSEPVYCVVDEAGPAHRRQFMVSVRVAGETLATGEGKSKKEAQQKAARMALDALAHDATAGAEGADPVPAP